MEVAVARRERENGGWMECFFFLRPARMVDQDISESVNCSVMFNTSRAVQIASVIEPRLGGGGGVCCLLCVVWERDGRGGCGRGGGGSGAVGGFVVGSWFSPAYTRVSSEPCVQWSLQTSHP